MSYKEVPSKLPHVGTTIFTVMSALAEQHKAINLSQGFPNFNPSDRLVSLVSHYMHAGFNQYSPMPGVLRLRQRLSEKLERTYQVSYDPETEITITAGGTQAIFCAIAAFISPGDEAIILEPAYDSYAPAIEINGGIVRPHRLRAPDYQVNWDEVGKLISSRTRIIIINTPHNPSGKVLLEEDMQRLQDLIEGTDIIVISDEVYEHLIYDGVEHQSILRYPALRARSLAVYSFGKTLHATGWKTGYCVGPAYLTKEFRKVHQFNVFSANMPLQQAIADYIEDEETYLSLPAFYQRKRDYFLKAMKGSRFIPLACEGTYFQLFDYSKISDLPDDQFAKELTIQHGVAAIPVSSFYTGGCEDKVIRLCFAKTEDILAKAGELLRKI